MVKKVRFSFLTVLFILSLFLGGSNALVKALSYEDLGIKKQSVNPGNIIYPLKRLSEKIQVAITRNPQKKYSLYRSLTRKRMAELNQVVEDKNRGQMQKASERFSYFAGKTTEYLANQQIFNNEKNEFREELGYYRNVVEGFRQQFTFQESDWLLLSYSYDSLGSYIDILNK